VIRLTLLRSPADPDREADLGEHLVTYSLLPHAGSWDELTIPEAYALNDPLVVWQRDQTATDPTATEAGVISFLSVDRPNVVIETIKQAEDGNGLIVRLYECQRRRDEFTLSAGFPLGGAWKTNLLEQYGQPLSFDEHSVRCPIKPYQIMTLRLLPRAGVMNESAR
jgi:alpha-mannosidase